MKISLSVFSLNFLKHSSTFLEKLLADKNITLENIKYIYPKLHMYGLDGVEMLLHNNFTNADIESLRTLFQELKIPILSVHQPIRLFSTTDLKEVEQVFTAAKRLHANLIVLHSDMAGKQLFNPSYKKSITHMEKPYGITATFENMQKHYILFPNSLYYNPRKFEKTMHKNQYAITLDTTHLGQVNGNIVVFFQENKTLIKNIHISDFYPHFLSSLSIFATYKFHLSLGKGKLPIKEFLQLLKKERYTGIITMEIPRAFPELVHSIKMIKQYTT